jgi:hypothetical protein
MDSFLQLANPLWRHQSGALALPFFDRLAAASNSGRWPSTRLAVPFGGTNDGGEDVGEHNFKVKVSDYKVLADRDIRRISDELHEQFKATVTRYANGFAAEAYPTTGDERGVWDVALQLLHTVYELRNLDHIKPFSVRRLDVHVAATNGQ